MLCSTCGEKVQFKKGTLICKTCDFEFDMLDVDEELIPEPIYVVVQLSSHYAIIDTRKQAVYAHLDTSEKAQLITQLLNKNLAQTALNRQIDKYIGH